MTTDNLDTELEGIFLRTPRRSKKVLDHLPLQLVYEEYEVSFDEIELAELTVDRKHIDLKVDGDKRVVVVSKYVEVSLCESE
jgi:hypothetical protein